MLSDCMDAVAIFSCRERAAIVGGFGAEGVEAKPAFQLCGGVVMVVAPVAVVVVAGGIAEAGGQGEGVRVLVKDPGGDGGAAALGGEPGCEVRQRPRIGVGGVDGLSGVSSAGAAVEEGAQGLLSVVLGGGRGLSGFLEKAVVGVALGYGGQPVPGGQDVGMGSCSELCELVFQGGQREDAVQHRVVPDGADETAVLVVLDEVMVAMGGEGQWVELEGVEDR